MPTKRFFSSGAATLASVLAVATALAQPPARSGTSPPQTAGTSDSASLAREIRDLRTQVARLEAALTKTAPAGGGGTSGGGMMDDMMGMGGTGGGMMDMMKMGGQSGGMTDDDMMGGRSGGTAGGAGGIGGGMMGDMDMMGMMDMGSMGGANGMKMTAAAALPGFPGASHLYHIGATGFFLDHPQHITLSFEQQAALGRSRQKAVADKATAQRKIDEAEQQLWELTGADEPDIETIQAKVEEIEDLRGQQRLAFIRAVGEAAQVLTDEQRKALLGTAEPAPHAPDSHPTAK